MACTAKLLTILAAGLGLSACSDPVIEPAPEPLPPPAAEPMSWTFAEPAEGPKLVLGEPDTDNVRLMLACERRGGAVTASYVTAAVNPVNALVLVSGDHRAELETRVTPVELGQDAVSVSAELPADDAVLAAFRQSGELALYRAGDLVEADAGERADIERFFAACGL